MNDQQLARLVHAYHRGLLVPFLGAGMSHPACPLWSDFVRSLETAAGLAVSVNGSAAPLPQRADAAVRRLRMQGDDKLRHAVAISLGLQTLHQPPAQTAALARIWFPLVITTNYDSLYAGAFESSWSDRGRGFILKRRIHVKGRSAGDCQDVLRSLRAPSEPLLWAIQGYLGDWITAPADADHPANQLVVGHHDYRRATHRDGHFRKAFAEVFRSRSLLFLGSSLAEPYMLDLFGEVLEFYGANPQYHFAFVKRGEGNADFLRTRFNIEVLEYDDYADLPRWLNRLRNALNAPVPGMHSRRYTLASPPSAGTSITAPAPRGEGGSTDLEIVYSGLPLPDEPRACTAVSAGVGTEGQRYLSSSIRTLLEQALMEYPGFRMVPKAETAPRSEGAPARLGPCVDRFGETPLYCVVTRNDTGAHDLRVIGAAMEMLCDRASADGFEIVHTQLFAVGRGRAFPGPFSLVTMIRAFAGWRRSHPEAILRLVLHVIDPDVRLDIDSGRIDVLELLSCEEVRFWVEIRHDGPEAERHIELRGSETTLGEIAERYHAAGPRWRAEALPAPTHLQRLLSLTPDMLSLTLTEIGIVPGSTLRFRRHPE